MISTNNKIKPYHKMILPEMIPNNRIETDIQKMMYPVNLVLFFLLSPKFTIKDNYITPKGKIFYSLTFFFLICVYGLTVRRLFFGELEDTMGIYNFDIVNITYVSFYISICVGFTILFILNYVHRYINISIMLLIQTIYRGLDFSGSLKKVTRLNWISIISSICINIFLQFLYCGLYDDFTFGDTFLNLMFMNFDVNLVYGILVIILLRKYIEKWIEEVFKADGNECKKFDVFFYIYRNILEAFDLYKKIFELLILFHIFDSFFRVLCYFSIVLHILTVSASHSKEEKMQFLGGIFLTALWLVKDLFLVMIQCVYSEKFYIAVEEAETVCIQRLKNKNYLDHEETLSNKVMQANRTFFSKMSACGLFYIDASLPIEMMGILTSYVIVLLQSTFL